MSKNSCRTLLYILYDRRGGFLGGALEWFQRSYIIVMPCLWGDNLPCHPVKNVIFIYCQVKECHLRVILIKDQTDLGKVGNRPSQIWLIFNIYGTNVISEKYLAPKRLPDNRLPW